MPYAWAIAFVNLISQKPFEIMKIKNLHILVIGAGGIDGITAAHMKKAGYYVEVADNFPGLSARIQDQGGIFRGG